MTRTDLLAAVESARPWGATGADNAKGGLQPGQQDVALQPSQQDVALPGILKRYKQNDFNNFTNKAKSKLILKIYLYQVLDQASIP